MMVVPRFVGRDEDDDELTLVTGSEEHTFLLFGI